MISRFPSVTLTAAPSVSSGDLLPDVRLTSADVRADVTTKITLGDKAYYQSFLGVLIDLIVELLGLIIKPFDNQTES